MYNHPKNGSWNPGVAHLSHYDGFHVHHMNITFTIKCQFLQNTDLMSNIMKWPYTAELSKTLPPKKCREIPGRYKGICLLKWQFSDPTYFFVAENDTPIIEKGGLKSETAQVVIILQMYMVPLDN